MEDEKSTADSSTGKAKGPAPWLFFVMLAFIVGVLIFMMMLSPTRKGAGSSGQSAPSQSSH